MSAPTVLRPPAPTEALTRHPIPQLRRLVVIETEAEVVITGRVASYHQKQLAQEALRPTVGGRRLVNRVEVGSG
jgi:hypothetical protein